MTKEHKQSKKEDQKSMSYFVRVYNNMKQQMIVDNIIIAIDG